MVILFEYRLGRIKNHWISPRHGTVDREREDATWACGKLKTLWIFNIFDQFAPKSIVFCLITLDCSDDNTRYHSVAMSWLCVGVTKFFRSASSAEIARRISGGLTPKARVTPRAQDIHQRMLSNASETSSHASNEKPTPTTKEPPSYLQHIQTHSRHPYQVQSPLSVSLI